MKSYIRKLIAQMSDQVRTDTPKGKTPSWFVPEIQLPKNGNVVILDDDSTIHKIWDARFAKSSTVNHGVKIFHFSTAEQVREWSLGKKNGGEVIYLFDYELLGQKMNGLDIIESLNLSSNANLVTSRFEEKAVFKRCEKLGVKLIPKNMAEYVPIILLGSE
jgi:hypothetical protein